MKRNKYLDDIGIDIKNYGNNFIKNGKLQRFRERIKYGFDYSQTINMDLVFAEWLYSRLMMLKEQTMTDLTFHSVKFEGKTYRIGEAIDTILRISKRYLYYYEELYMIDESKGDYEEELLEEFKRATRLWAEILPYADRVVCRTHIY